MKRDKNTGSILLMLLFLVSCNVTKDYSKPDLQIPPQFGARQIGQSNMAILNRKDFFKNEKLVQLIDKAIEKNSEMQLAIQNIETAGAIFKKIKLNYLPELNLQINVNRNTSSKNSLAGISAQQFTSTTITQDFTASLALSWEIDIWGKIKMQKEAALSDYLQSLAVKKAIQTRLVADVANAYYNLLMLDNQLFVTKRNKQLGKNTLEILRIQFKYGDANVLGIQQTAAQLEQMKVLQSQIEQDISLQEISLSILCGSYPSAIDRQEKINNELNGINMDYDVAVLANRPDVFASELNLRSANARFGVAQASLYPTLSLSTQTGVNSLKVSNWFSVPASLFNTFAGGITQPIFNRGNLKLQKKHAKIDYEKAVINFRQSVLLAYGEVSAALIKEEKLNEQITYTKLRKLEIEKGIEVTKKLFKNGTVNYLEVITAENNYLQASLASALLQKEQIANKIELYRAVGGGWN
ncbi:efflux transporter outer membrane subunit [Pedobacter sp. MC2016-24]|uniref:efflux transporter outer membrane subunit n=1 Tax=Pedobacter sp. MC2016-24 TaxID=2780090 RepID=UPI0018812B39|nr:TolC family protein [Pedobacter sp. MC2016-24]MBE9601560.1 TolC family protein [Pedobacter sp. MC2016-24]